MIELGDLSTGMLVDLTNDEARSIGGGDGFGAAIGGGAGFAAAGTFSGGDLITATKGGLVGAGAGKLIDVLAYPQVGVPAAFVLGTAAGISQAVDSFNPFGNPISFDSATFGKTKI